MATATVNEKESDSLANIPFAQRLLFGLVAIAARNHLETVIECRPSGREWLAERRASRKSTLRRARRESVQ